MHLLISFSLLYSLTLEAPVSQIGQAQSKNYLAMADELFKYVWPFCGVLSQHLEMIFKIIQWTYDLTRTYIRRSYEFSDVT